MAKLRISQSVTAFPKGFRVTKSADSPNTIRVQSISDSSCIEIGVLEKNDLIRAIHAVAAAPASEVDTEIDQ